MLEILCFVFCVSRQRFSEHFGLYTLTNKRIILKPLDIFLKS